MSLDIVQHKSAADLLDRCQDLLSAYEAENNNMIHLLRLIAEESNVLQPPYWFGTIEHEGEPVGCCVHAAPDGLVTTRMPKNAAAPLYEAVSTHIPSLGRIVGEPGFLRELAGQFANRSNLDAKISSNWQVYRLDKVNTPDDQGNGLLRRATDLDRYLVEQWADAYGEERQPFLNVTEFMLGKLESQELYLWIDPGPRSMITTSGRGMSARRISSVFTPAEFRGRGYASRAVAAVSTELLRKGSEYVVLTAELGQAVVRIYERIGFYPVGHRRSYKLVQNSCRPAHQN